MNKVTPDDESLAFDILRHVVNGLRNGKSGSDMTRVVADMIADYRIGHVEQSKQPARTKKARGG